MFDSIAKGFTPYQTGGPSWLNGVMPQLASAIGYSPTQQNQAYGGANDPGDASYTNQWENFLSSKGYQLVNLTGPDGKAYQQIVGADGSPVTQPIQKTMDGTDGDNLFGAAVGLAAGFGGASALGAFGGAGGGAGSFGGIDMGGGAAGGAADAGGMAGTGIQPYAAYTGPGSAAGYAAGPGGLSADAVGGGIGDGAAADAAGMGLAEGAYPAGITAGGASGGGMLSSLGNAASSAGDWMKANPGLTNVGGSLVNGLIGAVTAHNALGAQTDATNQANALWAPYRDLGNTGVAGYKNLLQNPSSITSDPGYQFGLSQGVQGVDRSAASKGGLYSGATMKALTRYGTDYGGTKLSDALGRYSNAAQLGATGTANTANNITNLGSAGAGASMYTGNVLQNGLNSALGQFNFSNNGGYTNPFNQSTYVKPGNGP